MIAVFTLQFFLFHVYLLTPIYHPLHFPFVVAISHYIIHQKPNVTMLVCYWVWVVWLDEFHFTLKKKFLLIRPLVELVDGLGWLSALHKVWLCSLVPSIR